MMFAGDEDCDDEITSGPITDEPHTRECDRAARYYAAVREDARDGDEDAARALPAAQRALNRAREVCGC